LGPEQSLQSVLDAAYPPAGSMNVITSEQTAGMWQISTGLPGTIGPVITLEVTGLAGSNILGLFAGTDSTALSQYDLFLGPATTGKSAIVTWDNAGNMSVNAGTLGDCGTVVNCTAPIAPGGLGYINPFDLGFYLKVGGGPNTYYTADNLNPGGAAQALAFANNPQGGTWMIAFEDGDVNSGFTDYDYNDFAFKVESIEPIPEPRLISLLCVFMVGLFAVAYRRRKAA
jgi:hypothetical protein